MVASVAIKRRFITDRTKSLPPVEAGGAGSRSPDLLGELRRLGRVARPGDDPLALRGQQPGDAGTLAVNYPQAGEAVREAGGFAGKVLVDISNPITEDYNRRASPPWPGRATR
jgi:predicted dinucleotide-binding enzyme